MQSLRTSTNISLSRLEERCTFALNEAEDQRTAEQEVPATQTGETAREMKNWTSSLARKWREESRKMSAILKATQAEVCLQKTSVIKSTDERTIYPSGDNDK